MLSKKVKIFAYMSLFFLFIGSFIFAFSLETEKVVKPCKLENGQIIIDHMCESIQVKKNIYTFIFVFFSSIGLILALLMILIDLQERFSY